MFLKFFKIELYICLKQQSFEYDNFFKYCTFLQYFQGLKQNSRKYMRCSKSLNGILQVA